MERKSFNFYLLVWYCCRYFHNSDRIHSGNVGNCYSHSWTLCTEKVRDASCCFIFNCISMLKENLLIKPYTKVMKYCFTLQESVKMCHFRQWSIPIGCLRTCAVPRTVDGLHNGWRSRGGVSEICYAPFWDWQQQVDKTRVTRRTGKRLLSHLASPPSASAAAAAARLQRQWRHGLGVWRQRPGIIRWQWCAVFLSPALSPPSRPIALQQLPLPSPTRHYCWAYLWEPALQP